MAGETRPATSRSAASSHLISRFIALTPQYSSFGMAVELVSEARGERDAGISPRLAVRVASRRGLEEADHVAPIGIFLVGDVEQAGTDREIVVDPPEGGEIEHSRRRGAEAGGGADPDGA